MSEETGGVVPEFYIGTVISYSSSTGAKIQLDGQDSAMEKSFKRINSVAANDRVLIAKMNGTYIVIGRIR